MLTGLSTFGNLMQLSLHRDTFSVLHNIAFLELILAAFHLLSMPTMLTHSRFVIRSGCFLFSSQDGENEDDPLFVAVVNFLNWKSRILYFPSTSNKVFLMVCVPSFDLCSTVVVRRQGDGVPGLILLVNSNAE